MNKERIDAMLPLAYDILVDVGIAKNGEIEKSYRGQVSSFGAAISNGSLLAAIAAFSEQQGAAVHRERIPKAINRLLGSMVDEKQDGVQIQVPVYNGTVAINDNLFETVRGANDIPAITELILDCAIALKLAMNLYHLVDKSAKKKKKETTEDNGEEASD